MRSFILNENEMNELSKKQSTPFMVLSLDKVEENYRFLAKHLPRAKTCYAVKANPHDGILKRLAALGSHFDVASAGEMEMLAAVGVTGDRMIYANPVRDRCGLETAAHLGIRRFTFDDASEIPKLAKFVPGADVLVRIQVHNKKALVDLNTKFGAPGYRCPAAAPSSRRIRAACRRHMLPCRQPVSFNGGLRRSPAPCPPAFR